MELWNSLIKAEISIQAAALSSLAKSNKAPTIALSSLAWVASLKHSSGRTTVLSLE